MAQSDCPKCQGRMSVGFVVDNSYGTRGVAEWVEGPPVQSMWTGLKIHDRKKLAIETWRCSRCGFLENYAKG